MYRVSRRYARGEQRHLLCASTKNQDTRDKHRDKETKTGTNSEIKTNTNTDTNTKADSTFPILKNLTQVLISAFCP